MASCGPRPCSENPDEITDPEVEEEPSPDADMQIIRHSYLDGRVTYWSLNRFSTAFEHWTWRFLDFSYSQLAQLTVKEPQM